MPRRIRSSSSSPKKSPRRVSASRSTSPSKLKNVMFEQKYSSTLKQERSLDSQHHYDDFNYSYRDPINPTLNFLYKPHSISVLIAIIGYFIWTAFCGSSNAVEGSVSVNYLKGFGVAVVVFIFIGILNLRNGPFIRPHPAFWRAVLAASIAYLLFLIVILFQEKSEARRIISLFDPSLGHPLPERSYAEDCRLCWESIAPQLDVFVLAHIFGWYAKSLILRDVWLCWIISIMFEVMEYTLEFQLPNFAECWWDHWILDVLICNSLGIWMGMKTFDYLSMKVF